jgi:hypothetical protein
MLEVTWTSQNNDSEISSPQLIEPIVLVNSQFTVTDAEEAKQYGFEFPSPPQMTWATALGTFAESVQQIQAAKMLAKK